LLFTLFNYFVEYNNNNCCGVSALEEQQLGQALHRASAASLPSAALRAQGGAMESNAMARAAGIYWRPVLTLSSVEYRLTEISMSIGAD
jgi:hypothetical protein